MANSANLNRLISAFPDAKIGTMETYVINKRVYVTSGFLLGYFATGDRTLRNYIKKGMPVSDFTIQNQGGIKIFDLNDSIIWRMSNIDKTQSIKSKKDFEDIELTTESESIELKNDNARKVKADADKAEHDAEIAGLKKKNLEGSLVEAESLNIAQAELASIYITNYIDDKKILQVLLANKESIEISELLEAHYEKRIEDLDTLINKIFPNCDKSVYDIMYKALEMMRDDMSPKEIINKLGIKDA